MAAVLRKRKIIDTGFGDAHAPAVLAQRQPRIQQFGRLSKPGVPRGAKETRRTAPLPVPAETNTEPKKRRIEHQEAQPAPRPAPARPVTPPPPAAPAPCRAARLPPSQPGEPRRIAPVKKSARAKAGVAESPTQGARAILEAFVLAGSTPQKTSAEARIEADETAIASRAPSHELIALHAAFLNALSLHYAHEGTSTPAEVGQLALSVTRIWGRRRVRTEDIRRVLGVQQWQNSTNPDLPTLVLSDFSRGRLCIEYEPSDTTAPTAHAAPLPVATLKRIFAGNLLALGEAELPLAPITPFAPASTHSAFVSKGATRLADLKASALNAQANTARAEGLGIKPAASLAPAPVCSRPQKAVSRGASLLERICAKEAEAALQPAAPTAAAVARKAALQRLAEVIPIIEILAASRHGNAAPSSTSTSSAGSRGHSSSSADLAASLGLASRSAPPTATVASFTLPALVQHLQNSLRHPLAKAEGELCITLLASELLPRWVQIHSISNRMTSISVRGSVRRGEWMQKLRELLEEA